MLTPVEYSQFRTTFDTSFANYVHNLPNLPSYRAYENYEDLWQDYILSIVQPFVKQNHPKRIGLVVMESAPGGSPHPHPNYIFNHLNNVISNSDSYIRNIYNGSIITPGLYHKGLTKSQAINGLLSSYDNTQNLRPIILMDLLPTHGIKLESRIRTKLINGTGNIVNVDVSIKNKFLFLNSRLLKNGLSWRNVHLVFACPPSSSSTWLIGEINRIAPGIFIHKQNINSGSNVAPNPSHLRALIQHHGF